MALRRCQSPWKDQKERNVFTEWFSDLHMSIHICMPCTQTLDNDDDDDDGDSDGDIIF